MTSDAELYPWYTYQRASNIRILKLAIIQYAGKTYSEGKVNKGQ